MKAKNMAYIALSTLFLAASALGIGWLVKQEIEKGRQDRESMAMKKMNSGEVKSRETETEGNITIESKEQAGEVLDDVEDLMSSAEEEDLPEGQKPIGDNQ